MENDKLTYQQIREGWAFREGGDALHAAISKRYQEIKEDLNKIAKRRTIHNRGSNIVVYENIEELLQKYSQADLLIFADSGNLCFGGHIAGNQYTYFTD
jgi:Ni2+-binding GTPase involved in maturation of urease and hydrogenase